MKDVNISSIIFASILYLSSSVLQADFLAYSLDEKKGDQPLPQNIDKIDALNLVSVRWGDYKGKKTRVAVLKVKNRSSIASYSVIAPEVEISSDFGQDRIPVDGIEAIITDVMHRTNRFRLVERAVLDQTLGEQDLGASGRIASPSAAKIGKVLGAQFQLQAVVTNYETNVSSKGKGLGGLLGGTAGLLLGGISVKNSQSVVGMNFRLIDAETSEVVYTKQVESIIKASGVDFGAGGVGFTGGAVAALGGFMSDYSRTSVGQAVIAAIHKGIYDLIGEIGAQPATGSVIKVSGSKIYLNLGAGSVNVGGELEAYSVGEALIDPETGISLGSEEWVIGALQVTDVKEKYSFAKAVGFPASDLETGSKVVSMESTAGIEYGRKWKKKKKGLFK